MAVNVGLDIGTSAVRAAVVQTGKNAPILRKYGQVALPEGAVLGGEIADEAVVRDAIVQLWKQAKLPKKNVVVGIANQRVIVRRVDLPLMSEEELAESLPYQAQEFIPIPIEEAILDFVPLEEFTTPSNEPMMSVLVVAAQKGMAEDVVRVAGNAGLKVVAVDLQAFALVRAIYGGELNLEEGIDVVVNVGAALTQVAVVKTGTVRFLRIVPMGGHDFTTALQDSLATGPDAAESHKRRVGVALEGDAPAGESDDDKARAALTEQADLLIEEIRGSVDFFLSQAPETAINKLLVSGNGARLPHLAARLGRTLGVPVEPIRLLEGERMQVGKTGLSEAEFMEAQPVLPVAVGLALWGEV